MTTYNQLPCACGKQELYRLLNDIPEKELRDFVNEVIATNRKLDLEVAKYKKILRKNEVRKVMLHFGYLESEEKTANKKIPTVGRDLDWVM